MVSAASLAVGAAGSAARAVGSVARRAARWPWVRILFYLGVLLLVVGVALYFSQQSFWEGTLKVPVRVSGTKLVVGQWSAELATPVELSFDRLVRFDSFSLPSTVSAPLESCSIATSGKVVIVVTIDGANYGPYCWEPIAYVGSGVVPVEIKVYLPPGQHKIKLTLYKDGEPIGSTDEVSFVLPDRAGVMR